jgi:DNA-binding response OmpR family regulator
MNEDTAILVVDDDAEILNAMKMILESAGYIVAAANCGQQAIEVLESQPVRLILADVAMPGMNGYQLLEHIRQNRHWVPIPYLFLSARSLDSDIRYGKELGADDYLLKPISAPDLLAAVKGRLSRARQLNSALTKQTGPFSNGRRSRRQFVEVGRLRINSGQHRVWYANQKVTLSAREFRLLEHLAKQADRVISVEELVTITHGYEADSQEAGTLLRPMIRSVRRKLGYPPGDAGCIENVRGVGYRLLRPH